MSATRRLVLSFLVGMLLGVALVLNSLEVLHRVVDVRSSHGFCGILYDATKQLAGPVTRELTVVYKWFVWPVRTLYFTWFEQDEEPSSIYLHEEGQPGWHLVPSKDTYDR